MPRSDSIAAVVIFCFATAAFLMARDYTGGAEIFPKAISGLMMLCSVLLFVRGIARPAQQSNLTGPELGRLGVSIVLTLLYIAAIVPVGFVTSSLIYVPLAAYSLGLRNHLLIWVTTLGFVFSLYFLFAYVFYTPLPRDLIIRWF